MFDDQDRARRPRRPAGWQKLNVTAFLMSGVVGGAPEIVGEPYRDAAGNR